VRRAYARIWFGSLSLLVLTGITIQYVVIGDVAGGPGGSSELRAVNVLSYFSIESTLLVGIAAVLLAVRTDRSSMAFRVFWFTGLIAIITTGAVYHAFFGNLVNFTGWGLVGDQILHSAVPVMAVVGWLLFGPPGLASWQVAARSLLFPLGWLVVTLIRGWLTGWYPYPFIDVGKLGARSGYTNVILLALAVSGVSLAATAVDRCRNRWCQVRTHADGPESETQVP
jgi:hypothetical protein